jgi:hypothetical protein
MGPKVGEFLVVPNPILEFVTGGAREGEEEEAWWSCTIKTSAFDEGAATPKEALGLAAAGRCEEANCSGKRKIAEGFLICIQ